MYLAALGSLTQHGHLLGSLRSSSSFVTLAVAAGIFTVWFTLCQRACVDCARWAYLFDVRQDLFLYGAILPILPFTLVDREHTAPVDAQRGVSVLIGVYGAGFLSTTALCGALPDHRSRRTPILIGLLFLIGGTLMLCLGRSMAVLIIGRILQGLSGGVIWVEGLAFLADVHDAGRVGRAMGLVFTAFAAGYLMAPLLAGVLYARGGYYATYGMMLAVVGVDLLLWLLVLPPPIQLGGASPSSRSARERTVHAARGRSHGAILGELICAPRTYAVGWVVFVISASMAVLESTLATFVQEVFHWDAFGAGLAFIPLLAPCLLGGYFIGCAVDRYGPCWPAVAGCAVCIPSWILLRCVTHDTTSQKVLFCVLLFCAGTGTEAVTVAAMTENRSLCSSSFTLGFAVFSFATGASIQVGGFLSGALDRSGGWSLVTLIPGLLCISGLVCVLVTFEGRHMKVPRPGDLENHGTDKIHATTVETKE